MAKGRGSKIRKFLRHLNERFMREPGEAAAAPSQVLRPGATGNWVVTERGAHLWSAQERRTRFLGVRPDVCRQVLQRWGHSRHDCHSHLLQPAGAGGLKTSRWTSQSWTCQAAIDRTRRMRRSVTSLRSRSENSKPRLPNSRIASSIFEDGSRLKKSCIQNVFEPPGADMASPSLLTHHAQMREILHSRRPIEKSDRKAVRIAALARMGEL
mmetsp:Transcript_28420/g.51333  ORF Transcript_28420/g.51333 Transcript_28420/m.51333 type:complete len:211 (-) Transcript_28420:235-867(-)